MSRVSIGLWLAIAGAVLGVIALGSNFYVTTENGEQTSQDAWFGVPHTSQLILAAAVVTIVLAALTAANRQPIRGRSVGILIAVLGLLATLQLGYRMLAPPFDFELADREVLRLTGSCLWYCPPSEAADAELLPGIWIGFVGTLAMLLGGLIHAFTPTAGRTPARPWRARVQRGMTPWLGLAGLGALAMFIFGYTWFTFYRTPADGGMRAWSGWLPSPHTSVLVLWMTILTVGLVVLAARNRAPLSPAAMGGLVTVFGFVAGARILYRIIEPPFQGGTMTGVEIGIGGILALVGAIVVIIGGIGQALAYRETAEVSAGEPRTA